MRIYDKDGNPQDVPGIFQFKAGLELTQGDYVIYRINGVGSHVDLLYLVNAEHISDANNTPDKDSTLYTEYSLLNAIKDSDDLIDPTNNGKLVTGSVLKSFVNNYIKGIDSSGNIQVKNISSDQDFNPADYIETCIYKLNIVSSSMPRILPSGASNELIFKCYRINDDVVQELLDYKRGQIYLWNFNVDSDDQPTWNPDETSDDDSRHWKPVADLDSTILSDIAAVNNKINSVYNIFCNMNRVGMYDLSKYIQTPTQIVIDNNQSNLLSNVKYIELVVTFKTSSDSIPQQDVVRLNMIGDAETIGDSQDVDRYKFRVTRTIDQVNNTTIITVIDQAALQFIEISKAIIVK